MEWIGMVLLIIVTAVIVYLGLKGDEWFWNYLHHEDDKE